MYCFFRIVLNIEFSPLHITFRIAFPQGVLLLHKMLGFLLGCVEFIVYIEESDI